MDTTAFRQGRVLLLVNEKGDLAVAQMTEANKLTVVKGWDDGGSWRRR